MSLSRRRSSWSKNTAKVGEKTFRELAPTEEKTVDRPRCKVKSSSENWLQLKKTLWIGRAVRSNLQIPVKQNTIADFNYETRTVLVFCLKIFLLFELFVNHYHYL